MTASTQSSSQCGESSVDLLAQESSQLYDAAAMDDADGTLYDAFSVAWLERAADEAAEYDRIRMRSQPLKHGFPLLMPWLRDLKNKVVFSTDADDTTPQSSLAQDTLLDHDGDDYCHMDTQIETPAEDDRAVTSGVPTGASSSRQFAFNLGRPIVIVLDD